LEKKASSRSFALSVRKLAALRARSDGGIPNPFNTGFYYFFLETLKLLGANRSHPRRAVIATFRKLANAPRTLRNGRTFWQRWKGKSAALSWQSRFDQNADVLQRVPRPGVVNKTPYGLKLLQVGPKLLRTHGVVIDILRGANGEKFFRLNTDSPFPVNQFRTRREDSRKAQVTRFRRLRQLAQGGKCAICRRKRRRLCVDHCHTRGHLRGLLCNRCNSGVGFFGDSPPLLLRAALYLMATANNEIPEEA
jgi:hypothetical protein